MKHWRRFTGRPARDWSSWVPHSDIGGQIRVDPRVQDTSTGEIVSTAPELGSEAQFFELVKRAGQSLRQNCGAGELTVEQRAATNASQPGGTEAMRLYSEA